MAHLSNEEFLSQLAGLYREAKTKSRAVTVYLKPYDGRTKPLKRGEEMGDDIHGFFRAKCGNKRISTEVKSKDVNKFHHAYVGVLRASMDKLEKPKEEKPGKS